MPIPVCLHLGHLVIYFPTHVALEQNNLAVWEAPLIKKKTPKYFGRWKKDFLAL